MSDNAPRKISAETVYEGRKLTIEAHQIEDPSGRPATHEVIRHPGSVAILALRTADQGRREVLMERNFRYTAGQVMIEIPAGTLDRPGEPREDCARRELTEETGYRAETMTELLTVMPSPGFLSERLTAFVAEGLTEGQSALEPGEIIEPVWMAWDDVLRMIRDGEIVDGKTIAAVLYYEQFAAGA